MKKNLQNAMAQNFQKMVGTPTSQEQRVEDNNKIVHEQISEADPTEIVSTVTESMTSSVPDQVVNNVPVQQAPIQQTQPVDQIVQEPVNMPTTPINPPVEVQNIPVQENIAVDTSETYNQVEPVRHTRNLKKSIPLMPEEKSSGVLHIRLGELRSYVDFMTQSGKISYQQYISNLIEQDYEKNKDLYLKYKSFMEQLNL